MVWDNSFDLYRDLCIETGDGNTIDLTPYVTNIGFISHVPTGEERRTLPHIEVTSGSEWNPNTMKLGKVSMDQNDDTFELQRHVFGYHTTQTEKCAYSDNSTDGAVLHYIKPALFELGAKLKRKISEITTPANDEIPAIRTFVYHARHLRASSELIADLWCIGLKIPQAKLGATTHIGIKSAILPLARRYRSGRVFSMRWLNERSATDTLFSDVKSLK